MVYNNILAVTVAFLLLASSYALSIDSSAHLARHKLIAARQPVSKRSSGGSRCKAPPSPSSSVAAKAIPSLAAAPPKAASPSPSPNPAPYKAPPPPPSGTPGGKRGLAWAGDDNELANFNSASFFYNWNPTAPPNRHGMRYCAMLWGKDFIDAFVSIIKPGYTDCILGYNEPNLGAQGNLPPDEAATIWMDHVLPLNLAGYTSIVAPAVTSAMDGKTWLKTFFGNCTDCRFTAMALHYYGTSSDGMISYLTDMHQRFNMNIWVTEFACQDFTGGPQADTDIIFAFMSNITNWMDNTPWIEYYSAFGFQHNMGNVNVLNRLMDSNGMPTPLGRLYLGK